MRVRMKRGGALVDYLVAAGSVGADKDLMMLNSAGYLAPAAAAAGNKGVVGVLVEPYDNTGGLDGAFGAVVEEGVVEIDAVGLTQADVRTTAYASSGVLVSGVQAANQPIVGPFSRIRSATRADVHVGAVAADLVTS